MLTIKTDLKDTSWLKYIIGQFCKINLAKFQIEIVHISEEHKFENLIFYSKKYIKNYINIFNSDEKIPNGKIEYLKSDLFVLSGTLGNSFDLKYDLFWNAFVFLSRYEEYLSEVNGKNIYSYSLNHPRVDKKSFEIPIVNVLFNELEDFLKNNFQDLKFGNKKDAIVDFSHDLDYINKTIQLRFKQSAFNCFNTFKSILKPKQFITNLSKTIKFAFSNPSYWCFDYWQELENKNNIRSTFYIYAKTGKKTFKSWLIDPSYNVSIDKNLQNKLKQLHQNGFKIGLHGSYESAKKFEQLKNEKETLEQALDIDIVKTRQHWLNYFEQITPKSHDKLFKYDSTLGWNDIIGFRSGCASLYQPYDFKNKKAFNYEIIPQIIMDSHIYDYSNDEQIFAKAKTMISIAKHIPKSSYFSLSWHQRVCSSDYNWHKFYEEIVVDL